MFCIKCGTKSIEDAGFCQKCGTKLVVEDTSTQISDTPVSIPTPMPPPSTLEVSKPAEPPPAVSKPTPVTEPTQEIRQVTPPEVATPANNKKKWIIIGGAAAVVATVAIVFALVLLPMMNRNRIRTVEPTQTIDGVRWGEIDNGRVGLSISASWFYQIEPHNWGDERGSGYLIRILDARESHIVSVIVSPTSQRRLEQLTMDTLPEHFSILEFNDGNLGAFDSINHVWTNGDVEMVLLLSLEGNSLLRRLYNETGGFGAYEKIINSIARTLTDPTQTRAAFSPDAEWREQQAGAEEEWIDIYHPDGFMFSIPASWSYEVGEWGQANIFPDDLGGDVWMGVSLSHLPPHALLEWKQDSVSWVGFRSWGEFLFEDGQTGYYFDFGHALYWFNTSGLWFIEFRLYNENISRCNDNEEVILRVARSLRQLPDTRLGRQILPDSTDERFVGRWKDDSRTVNLGQSGHNVLEFFADGTGFSRGYSLFLDTETNIVETIVDEGRFAWGTEADTLVLVTSWREYNFIYEFDSNRLYVSGDGADYTAIIRIPEVYYIAGYAIPQVMFDSEERISQLWGDMLIQTDVNPARGYRRLLLFDDWSVNMAYIAIYFNIDAPYEVLRVTIWSDVNPLRFHIDCWEQYRRLTFSDVDDMFIGVFFDEYVSVAGQSVSVIIVQEQQFYLRFEFESLATARYAMNVTLATSRENLQP